MYCKHCGQETSDEEVFCWYCGKRVKPTSVVFNGAHKEVLNAYTVREYSKSGFYLIGNLGFGFVILNDNNKKLVVDTLFEDIITQGRKNVDSILVKKSGKWGLINPITGVMHTGWLDYEGEKCYFEPQKGYRRGQAYRNRIALIDGELWEFDEKCYGKPIADSFNWG
jgi:hypothetical protein